MITAVPNRGNQSFMNELINHQLYEMTGKNQNILRYGTIGNKMRSRGTKMDEYPTTLDKKNNVRIFYRPTIGVSLLLRANNV